MALAPQQEGGVGVVGDVAEAVGQAPLGHLEGPLQQPKHQVTNM